MNKIITFLLLILFFACNKKTDKQLEVENEEFIIKKHLSKDVCFEKKYDADGLLVEEKWFYNGNKKPFLKLNPNTREQEYNKELFNENILDTPEIIQNQLNDSTYELKIIPKNFPIRLMSLIGWSYISDVRLEQETKFNSYILIANSNSTIKDSVPFLTFKFYDPITDRLIKTIDNIPLKFNQPNRSQ